MRCHKAILFSFPCSDYLVQVLFMSPTTVFYKAKPKAHIIYVAQEAVASQRSQRSTSQETFLESWNSHSKAYLETLAKILDMPAREESLELYSVFWLACSTLSDSGEDAKEKGTRTVGGPFYFRVCAFSIQRTRLSRSPEQAMFWSDNLVPRVLSWERGCWSDWSTPQQKVLRHGNRCPARVRRRYFSGGTHGKKRLPAIRLCPHAITLPNLYCKVILIL